MSLIKCKECGSEVSSKAKTCPKCGVEIASKPIGLGKVFGVVFLAIIIVSVWGGILGDGNKSGLEQSSSEEIKINNSWQYFDHKDNMTGVSSTSASRESINTVNFEFPYQGIQRGTIRIYKQGINFSIEKGQLTCGKKCSITIKMDDSSPLEFNVFSQGDESKTLGFFNNDVDLRKLIYSGKKMKIRVQVYKQGYPDFDFDVSGLDPSKLK